ncbi:hypothetical protein JCM3765_000733 [Sporobolomyces pararoseus]
MSVFPSVGTVYSSLHAFKLDCFERGLHHSLHLVTQRSSVDHYQEICCGVKVGLDQDFCNFRVLAVNKEGVTRVTQVHEEHSCSDDLRKANEEEAKRMMGVRIEKLKELVAAEELEVSSPSGRAVYDGALKQESVEAEEDDEEEGGEDYVQEWSEEEEELERAISRKGRRKSKKRTRAVSNLSEVRKRVRTIFPTKADLQIEIQTLSRQGPVPLPTPDQRFDSARHLLVQLHTFAAQNGFTIYRWSSHLLTSQLKMTCFRRTSRYKGAPGGCCPYELRAEEIGQSGKWRFIETVGNHNHPLSSFNNQVTSQSSNETPAAFPSRPSQKITSSASTPFDLHYPYPTPSLPPTAPFSNSTSPLQTSNHHPSRSSSPSDLISFLRSFNSSPPFLQHTLSTLSSAGIRSIDDLIAILSMSQRGMERVASKIEGDVGNELRKIAKELHEAVGRKE